MWFYPDSHSVFFPKATRCVILSLLHFNKFFKTLLTHSTCRGIFLVNPIDFVDWFKFIHKMWSCSFWTQPQKVVGYHRETHHFREEKSTKNLPPRNTPDSFCRCFTRQNPSLCCMGGIFLLRETHLENLMSRPNMIPTFRQRRCTNRGRNCVRSKRWPTYMSSTTSTYFLRLNNSETTTQKRFWAQR